ncbi:hypothetical protein KUTeg_017148 [Tegillarca granosa]|uniref:Uncharacterized protein n=1 Tax=Tegillarca granosa TaxID=220873 RepID=A0ABQ9EMX1_TEGGR|nr:hypothetical protein KUTeg_017148 [Tegillarca granosa]
MSASSSDQSSASDGNPTPAKKQKTSDIDPPVSTSTQLATSIPYVTSVPVISGTTGSPALQTGALSFTISNGELHFKPVSVRENATTPVGIQPTSNALPGTIAMVKGLNPHNLKIPTPNQQIRTTAFVAQSPGISSSTAATFTVRPGMTLVARQGFPMQALQTAVQQAQQQQPKTLKGQTTSQVQIQPQQIQINPQTAVIQTSKVVQGHMALGQVSLTQFTQANPTSVNQTSPQSTVQFQHKLQPQLVTKILPNQTQPIQVKQLTKSQQMQIAQCKTVTQIPLVVTQLSQNSQQTSQPKVTTTLTQSQAPVMQTWTLTQIPQGLAKGQEISKSVNPLIINPVQAKLQPQASSLPKVLSPISPQTKPPLLTQAKPQEIQIKAQVIPDIKQSGNTTQIKLPIPSNVSIKKHEAVSVKSSNPNLLPKVNKEIPEKSTSSTTKSLNNVEVTVKSVPTADKSDSAKVASEPEKDQGSVKIKETTKEDGTQNKKSGEISSSIPTVVLEETAKEQKEIKKEIKEIPGMSKEGYLKENKIDLNKGNEGKTECSNKDKPEKGNNSQSENTSVKKVTEIETKVDEVVMKSEDDNKIDNEMEEKMDTSVSCESENKNDSLVKQEVKNEKVEPNVDSENSQDSVEFKKMESEPETKEVIDKKDDSVTGDFDAVGAMNWEDGIGTLEGSDLKFKMNEFGVLEVITDELECEETLNLSSESEDNKSKGGGDADDNDLKKSGDSINNVSVPSSDGDKKDEPVTPTAFRVGTVS